MIPGLPDLTGSPVNPHDDPERQKLEQKLWDDEQLETQAHATLEAERQYHDVAAGAGHPTPHTDDRITELEDRERHYAGQVVGDQQAIEHWDHAHPLSAPTHAVEAGIDAVYGVANELVHGFTGENLPEFSAEAYAEQVWEGQDEGGDAQ